MNEYKRKVAAKLAIRDILTSTYIKRPGWDPSGILTRQGEASRVNIMGIVVSYDENSLIIDDGTGNIQVRFFNMPLPDTLQVGKLFQVIGRPREWESAKYLVAEIAKNIDDLAWFRLRQKELELQSMTDIKLPVEKQPEEEFEIGPYQQILNIIAVMDKGKGADIQDIIGHIKLPGTEKIIRDLIQEGEIFELSPGRVKILE